MIHICYGLHDRDGRYSKFVGTSIASVFENTKESVKIHILHDNTLTSQNTNRFNLLADRYKQKIKFYNVEQLIPDKIKEYSERLSDVLNSNYSIATLYRLIIPELMSDIERIIYLDADIIVNRDIKDLWDIDLSGKTIAAVPEILIDISFHANKGSKYLINSGIVKAEDYFNAGVLLIDVKKLNSDDILMNGYNFVCDHSECKYFDQDILNYCFANDYVKLSPDFDVFINTERIIHRPNKLRPAIYHYIGKSIQIDMRDIFNGLYFSYFFKTPWANASNIINIFRKVIENYAAYQKLLAQTTAMLDGRSRGFFVDKNNIQAIKQIFDVKDDSTIINSSEPKAVEKLIKAMEEHRGKKVFFLLLGSYDSFSKILISKNFVEGQDFVNAMTFLPIQYYGVIAETHSIVQAM